MRSRDAIPICILAAGTRIARHLALFSRGTKDFLDGQLFFGLDIKQHCILRLCKKEFEIVSKQIKLVYDIIPCYLIFFYLLAIY